MSLGKYPAITLKEARDLVFRAQKLKENGINPIEHGQQEKRKQKNTVSSLILAWYDSYIEKNRKQPLQIKQQIKADIIIKSGEPLSDKAITKAVSRIQERVGIPHWTPHDLRRTFATQLGETLDIDPVVIEKCLGHKMPKIMATYNKNEMLIQRKEALTKWSHYLESLLQDNVIPMQARKNS